MHLLKKIFCLLICGFCMSANALELAGTTFVNVTSDTADVAKTQAFDDARKKIFLEQVSKYANPGQVANVVNNTKKSDLENMVVSSSIDGERVSDTTYSANVSMVFDVDAVRSWLNENNIQNLLVEKQVSVDNTRVMVVLNSPVVDWASLNAVARSVGVDMMTKDIVGNRIVFQIPTAKISAFSVNARGYGWKVSDFDGGLSLWK